MIVTLVVLLDQEGGLGEQDDLAATFLFKGALDDDAAITRALEEYAAELNMEEETQQWTPAKLASRHYALVRSQEVG